MSSGKIFLLPFILFLLLVVSCGKEKENEPASLYKDNEYVLKKVKTFLGDNTRFARAAAFSTEKGIHIAAGTEISDKNQWGIKFYHLKVEDESLKKVYETELLQGSFKECLADKIKFPNFNYELVYYNSQNYFMGSGGGEVFVYIIDLNIKQVYYAHLVIEPDKPVSLFISPNLKSSEIKNFILAIFKKDYPSFVLSEKDIELNY
ncbi:MAG: hypothetical protein HXY49_11630 [Ignavibacteriaceae bacterium]|nr:hypothetical protein [Ignavibacteriaceae bacterium]